MLRRMRWAEMTPEERSWLRGRGTAAETTDSLRSSIRALVDDVRSRGDAAIVDALARHDEVEIDPSNLRVADAEFREASARLHAGVSDAIDVMIGNIRRFNEELLARRSGWTVELSPGHLVGERVGPVDSVAVFCPSGKASYPSVLAQVATPAVVAGVRQLTVIVPPEPAGSGDVDPAVLVVARKLGIADVYRVNGPAGVAAAAFGTESIPAHGMVVGPGSPAVTLAQMEIRTHGVDSVVLGPTESLIVADESADVDLLVADLLNEAEHGTDSTVVLVTASNTLIDDVSRRMPGAAGRLPDRRREAAESALGRNGGAVLVENLDEAIDVANWFAAEHCQLAVADPTAAAKRIDHAGELLLGQLPFSVGNFTLGGPAALPTGGFARWSGGITVATFLKATAIGQLTDEALKAVADATITLADHEGFPAHAEAIHARRRIGRG